mgnify:CR=1 FL=1
MRVYLDNCCYSRPYDDQSSTRVVLETQAKLKIQRLIKEGKVELASSYISLYECGRNTDSEASRIVADFININSVAYVTSKNEEKIRDIARGIMKSGIKFYDAYHVAAAILSKADYFISVDKRLLRYETDEIKLINPVDFFLKEESEKFVESEEV